MKHQHILSRWKVHSLFIYFNYVWPNKTKWSVKVVSTAILYQSTSSVLNWRFIRVAVACELSRLNLVAQPNCMNLLTHIDIMSTSYVTVIVAVNIWPLFLTEIYRRQAKMDKVQCVTNFSKTGSFNSVGSWGNQFTYPTDRDYVSETCTSDSHEDLNPYQGL